MTHAFFSAREAQTFETVIVVTGRAKGQVTGSPLFLKLPLTRGLLL